MNKFYLYYGPDTKYFSIITRPLVSQLTWPKRFKTMGFKFLTSEQAEK